MNSGSFGQWSILTIALLSVARAAPAIPAPVIIPGDTIFEYPFEAIIIVPDSTRVFYTTDGSDPDEKSEPYHEGLTVPIDSSMTLKTVAIPYKNYPTLKSGIVMVRYTQKLQTPRINWAFNPSREYTFLNSIEITFVPVSIGNTAYYTTDRCDPDTNSLRYAGPFKLYETTEIRVFQTRKNAIDSDTGVYIVEKLAVSVTDQEKTHFLPVCGNEGSVMYLLNGKLIGKSGHTGITIKNSKKILNTGTKTYKR